MVEAMVAFLVVALLAGLAVQIFRAQSIAVKYNVGLPWMNTSVASELGQFRATPYAAEPSANPGTLGTSDAGEKIVAVRMASFNPALGLRTHTVTAFGDNPNRFTMGGSARLEPVKRSPWTPSVAESELARSTHILTLSTSSAIKGSVSGGGSFAFGATVPIRAVANPGRAFVRWDGDANVLSPTSASTTVIIDEDRKLTAIFSP